MSFLTFILCLTINNKNLREQDNSLADNQQNNEKLIFFEKKNEKLVLENNKLKNKISLLSGQYFELIKTFQKKIMDFNSFAIKESETFNQFKENISNDLHLYIEKVICFSF